MIRVGLILNDGGSGWMGGVNYVRNLLKSVHGSKLIEPVVLTGAEPPPGLANEIGRLELIKDSAFLNKGVMHLTRKATARLLDQDFLLERTLGKYKINVLSHSGHLERRSHFPTVGWIPDFQHTRMPQFFSSAEIRQRNRSYARAADAYTRLILSSEDAKRDLAVFRESAAEKARVLPFLSTTDGNTEGGTSRAHLLERYGLPQSYFLVPNQFWAHKNHAVLIETVALARAQGHPMCIVNTGSTIDSRNPDHFSRLLKRVREAGCENDFKVLGLIPGADLAMLMRYSVAIINPSLFEGWSTSVEEAKSIGKTIILSDIPVHREQDPPFGIFFAPDSSEALASILWEVLSSHSETLDDERFAAATANLPLRMSAFRQKYEQIIAEAVEATPSNFSIRTH